MLPIMLQLEMGIIQWYTSTLTYTSPTLKSGIQYVKVVFCNYFRTVEELFIVRETNANVFIPKVVWENAEN